MSRLDVLLLSAAVVTGACGGSDPAESRRCDLPKPVEDLSLLPRDVPLDEWAVVDQIEVRSGFLAARGVTETKIVELYPVIARAIVDEDYTILSGDNEGFEAEIFFKRGRGTTGNYFLREGPCEGQVTIRLLYGSDRYRRLS